MTTTTSQTLRKAYIRDPWVARALGRAIAFRDAARWDVENSVSPYTRESFRWLMRSAARDAVFQAKLHVGGVK